MQELVLVNASNLLRDSQVADMVAPLQIQVDRDFLPRWGGRATPVKIRYALASDIPLIDPKSWPIFLNKHSNDADALGWHDDQGGRIFSRVFVGDCIRFGLDYGVTISHELLELILDPDIKRVWKMPNGRLAALEACDAVEADQFGYMIGGMKVSNFVLPEYFSENRDGPWDFGGVLKGPCPELSEGGYQSVTDASGQWTQLQRDRSDGLAGRRAILLGHRRQARARLRTDQLVTVA